MKQIECQPNYERLFDMAVQSLIAAGEAAGVRGEDQLNGAAEIIGAIHKLKARRGKAQDQVVQLRDELAVARMRIKELDLLFGRYLLGMRSAVIELDYGDGPDAAMRWIRNGLIGPGQLPPDDATDAQAYFDREIKAVDAGMQEVMAFFDARRPSKTLSHA